MAELLSWKAALILLLLVIHCESKPWESTTNVSANEANTTPCPDELAGEKDEKIIVVKKQNPINVHPNTEDTTTPCPEESKKNEGIFAENVEKTLNDLEETLVEIIKNDDKSDSSEENSESTTTICPEELEKRKLESPKETLLKFTEETTDETTICPEELKKRKLGSPESESDNELKNEKENAININGNHINNSEQDLSELKAKHSEALLASSLQDSLKQPTTEKEDAPDDRFEIEPATEKLEQASTNGKNIVEKNQNSINVHPDTEGTTTPCPEESKKNEGIFAENAEKTLNNLGETLLQITKNDDRSDSPEENSESTTTICPEELEKQTLELPKETLLKFTEGTTDETTICPEELKKRKLGSPESESHNELENEKENAININGNHINKSEQDLSELKAKHSEALLAYSLQDSLKTSPTEKEDAPKDRFEIEPATEKLEQASTNGPEIVTKKREENKNHDISVKTLLDVQKDSALLKLIKDKFDPIPGTFLKVEPVNSDKARSKRQAVNYSPYYSGQPSYNPEGVAADPSGVNSNQNTQKSPQPVSYKNYQVQTQQTNSQTVPVGNYNNVRTYQQIHRQYQSLYPNKSYQNYGKPLQSSQNIRRYPSVNKNYYKITSGGNRRQYQTNARPSSTTYRPIRTNVQKKFRPSPVFP